MKSMKQGQERIARCNLGLFFCRSRCALLTNGLAAYGLLALVSSPMLAADWPKPVTPPTSSKSPVPVIAPSPANSLAAPFVGADSRRLLFLPPLIRNMQQGQLTPQRAWDEKLIDVDDLIWLLGTYIQPWGGFDGNIDESLRRELAALLVEHGVDKLQAPEKLPPSLRLWLADYYMSIGDEHTVPLCESILSEIKAPLGDEEPLAFQAIERMARYYSGHGEPEKGVQAWLRMTNCYADKNRFIPDALLEAARLYMRLGQEQKAQELRAQVPGYGNGWLSAMSVADQALEFLRQGRYEQSQKLLTREIGAERTDSGNIVIQMLLGRTYFKLEKFVEARRCSEAAIELYKANGNKAQQLGLDQAFRQAHDLAQWCETWHNKALLIYPPILNLTSRSREETLSGILTIDSAMLTPLKNWVR